MGYLILPALVLLFMPMPAVRAEQLEDFSRMSRAIGKEVALVDRGGLIRNGILEGANADGVTLRVGSATQSFARAEVASAARTKDGSIDGAIKGALLGFVLSAVASQACDAQPCPSQSWVPLIAGLTAAGYVIDATEVNGRPLYRAPSAPAPRLNISLRF